MIRRSLRHVRAAIVVFIAIMVSGLIFGSPGVALSVAPALNQTGFQVPSAGKVIVVLKEGRFTASADDVAVKVGVKLNLKYDAVFDGFSTTATQSQINKLAADPNVAYIAPDLPIEAAAQTPSSGISRTAISGFSQIDGVDNVANVGIAILDTGVQNNHPDLRYAGGADCAETGSDQPVAGMYGAHGTHVAGIAAAIDNSIGVVGAAPGARIYNYKVLKDSREGRSSWLICGINAAINNSDVKVINMSLAGDNTNSSTCDGPDPVREAVCSASGAGKLLVAAAGNNNADADNYMPAKYPEVFTVANIADGSPVGAPGGDIFSASSNFGSVVELSAPGTGIMSTVPGDSYDSMSGTSMASPLVAGAAGQYIATTGASASSTTSWLMSTASVPMNTPNGCNCSADDGFPNRMLYLGGVTTTNPPGTQNPSFSGVKATITNSLDNPSTGTSVKARDGNVYSNWATPANYPSGATITFDLGSVQNLTGIRWKYGYLGYADAFRIRVSNSYGGAYQEIGPFGNATVAYTWFGTMTSVSGRFVQFVYTNPSNDPAIGSLAEVEIFRPETVNPPGTLNPAIPVGSSPLAITNSSDSPSTGTASRVYDGQSWSNWASAANTPPYAKFKLDLGADHDLSMVKWKMTYVGYADQFIVRVYSAGGEWQDLGVFGNPGSPNTWYGVVTSGTVTARFVEFIFLNPNNDPALGSVGEVEIYGGPVGFAAAQTEFTGSSLPIVASSETSGSSELAYDGDEETTFTASSRSTTSSATFDLGEERELTGVRWKSESDDLVTISTSADGQTWSESGTFITEPKPEDWQGTDEPEGSTARYVKVDFDATSSGGATADVSELEIWGLLPTGSSDPDLAGAVLPITCAADPESGEGGHAGGRACDLNGGTNWHTDANSPASATLTINLDEPTAISGIKWVFAQQGNAERFNVSVANGDTVTALGDFSGGAANLYEGIAFSDEVIADKVILTFTNVDQDTEVGYLAEVEVWSGDQPAATPQASPQGSPEASPEPIETETPAATPAAGTPEPIETETPVGTPEPVETETPQGSPAPVETATVEPTTDAATPEPATPEPTATTPPTEVPTQTPEPTAEITVGIISGTDGDPVNCRTSPVDGDPISQVAEGDEIEITGPAEEGWLPVLCDGQPGFISEAFVTVGSPQPTQPVETATSVDEATPTVEVTEEATATEAPTEEPVETPYPITDTGDTENSGTAWYASDDDDSTSWSVYPQQNPEQARLYFDLGSVLPIDRLTIELAQEGMLPFFEIWLSEDGEVWYNATPNGINGWNLWADEPHVFALGYDARYVRIVVPNVNESGLDEVGGIRQVEIWAGDIDETQYLTSLGEPTTPTPPPATEEPTAEPTEAVVEEPTAEPTEEVIPTDEVIPTEETLPPEESPTEEAVG